MDISTTASEIAACSASKWEADPDKTRGVKLNAALSRLALPRTHGHPGHGTGAQWFQQRIRDLRSNPDFQATAVDFARNVVHLFEGRYLVNKAMANVSRQTVCWAILSSYFGQAEKTGGAFLSSIQTLTTAMGVCSKNTTAAIVALLERLGLIVRVENHQDRRWLYIQPTEDLIQATRDFQRISLTAADTLFPSFGYAELFDKDLGVQERCFAAGLYSYIAIHASVLNHPHSQVFVAADGGTILLLKLMSLKGAARQGDDQIVEFPFDDIGNLFGLSRTHVRRLMRKAEAEGFVQLLQKGGRQVRLLPPLEDLFGNIVAAHVARAQLDMQLAMGDGTFASPRK